MTYSMNECWSDAILLVLATAGVFLLVLLPSVFKKNKKK